ncbi:MAG: GspH/FimT family pseudopilin [Methylococcaceae bacterium]
MRNHSKQLTGFTLIELVMVIIILGILSVVAVPKFFDKSFFEARGFADELLATLRYAQKTAIAQHRLVCVDLTAPAPATVTLNIASVSGASSCDTNLRLPASSSNVLTAPTGVSLSPAASISFNALGQASSSAVFTIANAPNTIKVVQETGYVYE